MAKKIFVGSSLSQFRDERQFIKDYFLDDRIRGEFEVYLCEDSTTGDMTADTQETEINDALKEADIAIFLVGQGVGEKTEEEFALAMERRDSMRIHLLRNSSVPVADGQKSWEEFSGMYLKDWRGEHYEKYWETDDDLKGILANIYDLAAGPKAFPAGELEYDEFIPADQDGRRNSCCHYFERPDVDGVLSSFLESDGNENRLLLLTGASTAGKTMAACKSIKKMTDHMVVALNAATAIDEVKRLAPARGQSVFATGKKILLLDDVQDMLFLRNTDQWKDNAIEDVLRRLFKIDNKDFHIIVTTYKGWIERTLSEFVSCKVHISPLTRSDMKAYWEELRSYGYLLGQKTRKGNTMGSLFINLDRANSIYLNALNERPGDPPAVSTKVKQLADAIKCIWMWKNHSRNEFGRLVDYLVTVYGWERSETQVQEIIQRLEGLISFRIDVSGDKFFEVEDIIVNEVFEFLPKDIENPENAVADAVDRMFGYFLKSSKDECGEGNLFRNCVKCQQMSIALEYSEVVRRGLHRLVCIHYGKQQKRKFKNVFELTGLEEVSPNVVGENVDWFQIFAGNIIRHERDEASAFRIWDKFGGKNPVALFALMKRLNDGRYYEDILDRITSDTDRSKIDSVYFDENKPYENALDYSLKMSLCLLPVVSMAQARKVYEGLNDVGVADAADEDDIYDFSDPFGLDDESEEDDSRKESAVMYRIPFEEMDRTQRYWCRMNREMCQYLLLKTRTLDEIQGLVRYLMNNHKGAVPENLADVLFFYLDGHTWKRWINEVEAPGERLKLFDYLNGIKVDRGDGVIESPLLQSKRRTLNILLETFDEVLALQCWEKMVDCHDSYSLHVILSKIGDLGTAMGVFRAFMDSAVGKKVRIEETILNDLLKIATTWSGVKECEALYKEYGLIGEDERISEAYSSEYTQGILHKVMTFRQIKSHLKFHRPAAGYRRIETLVALVEKAPDFAEARDMIFGDVFNEEWGVNAEELEILRGSARVVSLVFKAVKGNGDEAEEARKLFEDMMNAPKGSRWNNIFLHEDANVLNEVIKNKFIYPTYAEKLAVVNEADNKGCKPNSWTVKHLLLYQLKSLKNVDEKIDILNANLKKCDEKNLRDFIIGTRMECAFQKDCKSLNSKQMFPVRNGDVWEDKQMEISEYAEKLMVDGLMPAYALKHVLKNCVDDAELKRWQEMAIRYKVRLDWNQYTDLKKSGVTLEKPYLLVSQYALFKDICYDLNHKKGYTYDQAEEYIEKVSQEWGVSIRRTETYWNVVIGTISKDASRSREDKYEAIMRFLNEHGLTFNSERFYSMLHTIYSKQSYDDLKANYLRGRGRIMKPAEIRAAVSQIHDYSESALSRTDEEHTKKEWKLMNWYKEDYLEWCNLLKDKASDQDEAETMDKLRSTANKGLQTLDYRRLKVTVRKPYYKKGYHKGVVSKYRVDAMYYEARYGKENINWSFMFYWIIGWLVNPEKDFQAMRLVNAVDPKYYGVGADEFVKRLRESTKVYPCPESVIGDIRDILQNAHLYQKKEQVS